MVGIWKEIMEVAHAFRKIAALMWINSRIPHVIDVTASILHVSHHGKPPCHVKRRVDPQGLQKIGVVKLTR